jgi:transposase-like protein
MDFQPDSQIFHDAEAARAYLEATRWPNGAVCPHCGVEGDSTKLAGKTARPGLYQCNACREQFSVTVGTVFERSKIPLHKWLYASWLLCSSKKGISSHQLHRMIGVTYKTAWFMTHRIREAMNGVPTSKLGGPGSSGVVEADETYFGKTEGQGKGAHLGKKQKVVALVERGGAVRAFHVPSVNSDNLKDILDGHIHVDARLMTDSAPVYKKIGKDFKSHEVVDHTAGEYARGDVTTNSVEGFFGILKRGIGGVYQHVAPEHLPAYLNEFSFRYSHRKSTDTERTVSALKGIEGKRLTYRGTIKPAVLPT